VTDQKLRPA